MSSRHANQAGEILYSRYSTCLHDVDIAAILPHLIKKNLLTTTEQKAVMERTTSVNRRRNLCRILAQRGSSRLVATTTAIQEFTELHSQPQVPGNRAPDSSSGDGKRVISPLDGGNRKYCFHVAGHTSEGVPNGDYSSREVPTLANKKHRSRVDPGSPLKEEPPQCHEQMEAFIVLFFTFIYQILHGVHKSAKLSLPWFDASTSLEEVREYFPADAVRGINPGGSVQLHSSVLLEAFSQFYHKHDQLIQENKSLASTARLVQALTKRCTALEEELSQCRRKQNLMHCSRPSTEPRDHCATVEELRKQVGHLQAKATELLKQAEPLRRTLAKSEDRNKQLVDVTQQWAIECQEKENQIAVRDSQIRELRGENDQLKQRSSSLENRSKELLTEREQFKKKASKLKKQLSSVSERCREERVSDSQFEELRVELSYRRELYDQVLIQKEMAEDQVRHLTSQLEETKEMVEELRDRLGNFKVQAQGREPSVKEMSHLLQDNRALTEENSRLKQRNSVLEDEILAYKTHMEELARAAQHHQQAERGPRSPRRVDCPQPVPRQPPKTQTMVTGYRTAGMKKLSSHSNGQGHTQRASSTDEPHQATATATATAGSGRPRSAPSRSKSTTPTSTEKLPELREQESSSTAAGIQAAATTTDVSSELPTTDRPLTNGFTTTTTVTTGSHDYTREICYPSRSGVLIQPLQDDDWEILQSLNDTSQPQLPMYFDHTPLHPSKIEKEPPYITPTESPSVAAVIREEEPFFSFGQNERKCPVCQRVFLTLGQREFRSHIAGCFT